MSKETPESLLRRAKSLLRAGKRKEAALTAKKVIENHDFQDARAWRMLHTLAGGGRPFDEWQQHIAKTYYPDKADSLAGIDFPDTSAVEVKPRNRVNLLQIFSTIAIVLIVLSFFVDLNHISRVFSFGSTYIEIRVAGSGTAHLVYTDGPSNVSTHDETLPWSTGFYGRSGDHVSVTAVMAYDNISRVTCRIYRDGELWLKSSERYSCMLNGTIP